MAHNANDILDDEALSAELANWALRCGVRIGASCYSPAEARRILESRGMELFQVPANPLDQRVADAFPVPRQGLDLHVRSAFLQGLLLAGEPVAAARLPAASEALGRWYGWCRKMGIKPLDAALSIVKGFQSASGVVVGVDDSLQLDEIIDAWSMAKPLAEKGLATQDECIIDPRRWTNPASA
jgi:aryl-alcohol dehydrogenase-like predicted oxidoreductase